MKKINVILITLAISSFGLACSSGSDQSESAPEELVKSVNVQTEAISTSDFSSYVRVIGTVETTNDIVISSEVSGTVLSYEVGEGELVRKGQRIVKIDDAKLKQEAARLQAVASQAKDNYERLKKIYEEDGIGSEMDYLNAKYSYEQSNSALQSIKVDLANTEIKAPFTGTLETKLLEVGEMASPGSPVLRLIGANDFKITAGVPARYANAVKLNDEVDVWFDTPGMEMIRGTINYVGSSINAQNRTFKITVLLPDDAIDYKVDMIANIRLKTYEREDVIVVSEEFIYNKNNGYVVYIMDTQDEENPSAIEQVVELGMSYKSKVIVESGLNVGDQLITLGSAFLDDGMRVSLVNNSANTLSSN